ncbi:MAG: hypothetical protein Q8S71_08660 [Hydrogenophaga sp.]|jgi:hypothetical protein|nr:hypothetical protein [Hydrogenophaga sp.]MDP3323597.1 hypothetical protein [Hydrogenophaga sp.]
MDGQDTPPDASRRGMAEDVRRGLLAGLAILALVIPPVQQVLVQVAAPVSAGRLPDFGHTPASAATRQVVHWVAGTGNHSGQPFVVIDKKAARLYVFDAAARLRDSTPVLLGSAPGDDTVPGIGLRPIAEVRPEERTTPAGRFVGTPGRNHTGEDVVWVDHDAAVSMHRVRTTQPDERRLERLASPSIDDKRISYGCINVPADFYDTHIRPTFSSRRAVIYVLPEHKSLQQVFGFQEQPVTPGIPS